MLPPDCHSSSRAPTPPGHAGAAIHALIVDDQEDIREPLAAYLQARGLRVTTAGDAAGMRELLRSRAFDVIVLDIVLPDEDGLSLCRDIVRTLPTPVILLTAMADTADRITGLESGADDYVVKPFAPDELLARIRMVLRRRHPPPPAPAGRHGRRYGFDGWIFDTQRRELISPAGHAVALSEAEFRLLAVFVEHPNTVLGRERLLDLTRHGHVQVFDRSIDTQISRLRKKLEPNPRCPALLKTAWGNGYLFAADIRPLAPWSTERQPVDA